VHFEAVALFPLLPFLDGVKCDLREMLELLLCLHWCRCCVRKLAPGGLQLMVELLELGGGGSKAFDLRALQVPKVFVEP